MRCIRPLHLVHQFSIASLPAYSGFVPFFLCQVENLYRLVSCSEADTVAIDFELEPVGCIDPETGTLKSPVVQVMGRTGSVHALAPPCDAASAQKLRTSLHV
jgi:hypothetical protein